MDLELPPSPSSARSLKDIMQEERSRRRNTVSNLNILPYSIEDLEDEDDEEDNEETIGEEEESRSRLPARAESAPSLSSTKSTRNKSKTKLLKNDGNVRVSNNFFSPFTRILSGKNKQSNKSKKGTEQRDGRRKRSRSTPRSKKSRGDKLSSVEERLEELEKFAQAMKDMGDDPAELARKYNTKRR